MVLVMGVFMPEVKPLIDNMLLLESGQLLGRSYFRGIIGNNELVVTSGFVGKVESALVTQKFIDSFHPKSVVLLSGGGALDPTIKIGTVIAGTEFEEYDLSLHLTCASVTLKSSDFHIIRKLCAEYPEVKLGKIISGDQILSDSKKRDQLMADYKAICLDMDSAPFARTASENKIPYFVLKVILDHCDDNAEKDFNENFDKFASIPGKILSEFFKVHLAYMKQ